MVKRSVRVIMNVITNILRARRYERKKDVTKKTRNELTEIEKKGSSMQRRKLLIFYRNEEKNMGFRSLNLNIRSSVVHYTGRKTYELSKVHKKSTVLRYKNYLHSAAWMYHVKKYF